MRVADHDWNACPDGDWEHCWVAHQGLALCECGGFTECRFTRCVRCIARTDLRDAGELRQLGMGVEAAVLEGAAHASVRAWAAI